MKIRNLLSRLFYRQHPDTALRYFPLVDFIRQHKLQSIAEVGSGSYGIAPYLGQPVVGVDLEFREPEYPSLKQVYGSALDLPFKDNQFAAVILSDVLEHLKKDQRQQALNEAIRVASNFCLVSGPFGMKALHQDRQLAEYSKRKLHKVHPFFKEHLQFGLPEEIEVTTAVKDNPKVKSVKKQGCYLNLKVREWLMHFFITDNKFIFYFYLKGLMLVVPLLKLCNWPPTYRTFMVITLKDE